MEFSINLLRSLKKIVFVLPLLLISVVFFTYDTYACNNNSIASSPDAINFARKISAKHNIDFNFILNVFENSCFNDDVIDLMNKPFEQKSWEAYKNLVISKDKIKYGKQYLKDYKKNLQSAQKKYGVPENIIVAIIGVESFYGKAKLRHKAIESLSTLAFNYPRRGDFFKAELESLFILSKNNKINPLTYLSSYAGALGIPQFMPSNVQKYAVDGNNDGIIDISNQDPDAIHSVANYLMQKGWEKTNYLVEFVQKKEEVSADYSSTNPCDISKRKTVKEWKTLGIIFNKKIPENNKGILVKLRAENNGHFYAVFFENTCPIFRYNNSLNYTAAVSTLAEAIK